ncbi:MAG: hypothetical protein N2V78_02810 [Methanophagales archaeon]|nr:hypothetical protein [Methanophagales archaeon]
MAKGELVDMEKAEAAVKKEVEKKGEVIAIDIESTELRRRISASLTHN